MAGNIYFIFCIAARVALVWLAKNRVESLKYIGIMSLVISFGFFYIYANGLRKTGAEVFGGPIWWNDLRPIHGALYGLTAYSALGGLESAWWFLAVDVTIGVAAFLKHHYM